jgi:hypothetical protein
MTSLLKSAGRRTLAALPLAAALAACQAFAPAFDPEIAVPVAEANRGAATIVAEAEAGRFRDSAGFPAEAERYAALDARLAAAAARAGAARPGEAAAAARARRLLVAQIEGCRTELRALALIHRRSGIAPGAGLTEQAAAACDLAARAAGAAPE